MKFVTSFSYPPINFSILPKWKITNEVYHRSMENFVTGFPGSESGHRAAMLAVLGEEKYSHFFDKWLEYFFTEADARYFASLSLNCIRIPFNYRHFEDDMNPYVLKEGGFKHLDRVVDLVSFLLFWWLVILMHGLGERNSRVLCLLTWR